jgi:glycosyltransferase involved in cell wall biosynthesis
VQEGSGTYVGISVLRNTLVARGHQVELIAPRDPLRSALSRLWFNYRARKLTRMERPDVIVGFDLDGIFISPRGALNVASIKGVVAEELTFETGMVRASLLLQSYFEKQRVKRVDRILTTSHYAANALERHYGIPAEGIRIVPELIDLDRWKTALGSAHRERRPRASILCVAHLYPRKNVATLLHAMARLETRAALRIVGIGPELARLRDLSYKLGLTDRVTFLGHVPFAQLVHEYRSADVFCLPSRQEGFGIVLLEAMASGLPIVASCAAAIPEVVPDGECGVLVKPGDAEGFAAALDRLLNDPSARQRLGQAGRRRAVQYGAPLVAEQFLAAIGLQ